MITLANMELVELFHDPNDGQTVRRLPPFVRPRQPGGYFHEPRSAKIRPAGRHWSYDRLVVRFWCGQSRQIRLVPGRVRQDVLANFTGRRPPEQLCGTCDGRSEAFHDNASGTVFQPRDHFAGPTWCPFRGVWPADNGDDCPLCGHRLRYSPGINAYGCARHKARNDYTTGPCPSHGWQQIYAAPDGLVCQSYRCDYTAPYQEPT